MKQTCLELDISLSIDLAFFCLFRRSQLSIDSFLWSGVQQHSVVPNAFVGQCFCQTLLVLYAFDGVSRQPKLKNSLGCTAAELIMDSFCRPLWVFVSDFFVFSQRLFGFWVVTWWLWHNCVRTCRVQQDFLRLVAWMLETSTRPSAFGWEFRFAVKNKFIYTTRSSHVHIRNPWNFLCHPGLKLLALQHCSAHRRHTTCGTQTSVDLKPF